MYDRMDAFARRYGYLDYRSYNRAQVEKYNREQSMRFEVGDRVRLKDSPYEGNITGNGLGGTSFKDNKTGMEFTLRHRPDDALEYVLDPQEGDVYRDINGLEWVIVTHGSSDASYTALCAVLTSIRPFAYARTTVGLFQDGAVRKWADRYHPKLVRRRGE